jgi:DNA-binding response OmpR family regulator
MKGQKMKKFYRYKILIIDDETMILDLLGLCMSQKGYLVDTAGDGLAGLKKIQANIYDLIVTDIKMPGLSGNQIVEYVKHGNQCCTPVIGISGTPQFFKDSPFDVVLVKPFASEELLNVVGELLFQNDFAYSKQQQVAGNTNALY